MLTTFARSILGLALGTALGLGCCRPSTAAEPSTADAHFQEHLKAGEFGPAVLLAKQARGKVRDAMLRIIAQQQAATGARVASLQTIAEIQNDSDRSEALAGFSGSPLKPMGARGGAALADFDTLIDLIKSTIAPDTWDDRGGLGAAEPFPGGVLVDATGMLKRIETELADTALADVRHFSRTPSGNRDEQEKSVLRKVSLTRLERHVQLLSAAGKKPDEAMRVLAGMTKVRFLLVYPDTGDVVIAGPAGAWGSDPEGRAVNVESRRPVLQLDDFVTVLRNAMTADGKFGCSITPQRERLAAVREFLAESAKRSLKPGEQKKWLGDLREQLGAQDITVHGIDPRSHAARVLVEADYRMKLVGMGLEDGVLGVRSYLDNLVVPPGESPPPMDVLRWWFTLNYDTVKATKPRDAFELVGTGVKVLSENELLTERGERVHTGESKNATRQFALSFTTHFDDLAVKYPIYAELRNVFDLALVANLIQHEGLASRCDLHWTHFGPTGRFVCERGAAPRQVESVLNHRDIDRKQFIVGVSGGVSVDTQSVIRSPRLKTDDYGQLNAERGLAVPPELPATAWWWD